MEESELELYLDAIDRLDSRLREGDRPPFDIYEQQRDEYGYRVPGCFRTCPTPSYY